MVGNRLQIRRLRAEYLVSAHHPSPESVKDRLDRALTSQLTSTLSSAFSTWFSDTDPSIWLIRRVNIDVAVNASWDAEQLTRAVTRQFSRTLTENLQDSGDQNKVIRFSSSAAYLSSFLSDLAAGRAWGRWYYESFAGLRLLPTSTALRTAICNQPEMGTEALGHLEKRELNQVLRALTRHDARLILDRLAKAFPAGDESKCRQNALSAWHSVHADLFDGLEEWAQALYLYVTAFREKEDTGQNLKDAILDLLRCPPTLVNSEVLESRPAQSESGTTPTRRNTSFGGAFLLLPLLDELPLAEATRDWPLADEASSLLLVRFLILIKCAGQQRADRLFYDPLLRDLLLIPPGVSIKTFADWQSQITPKHLQDFLKVLARWQCTRIVGIDERQILVGLRFRGRQLIVLVDAVRGVWLFVERHSRRRPQRLINILRMVLSPLESTDGLLLCDPSLLETLWPQFPALRIVSLEDSATALSEKDQARRLPRVEGLADDLSYLSLPNSFTASPSLDLTLSVAAQNVLRAFAWKLPGFAGSNLPYLYRNFLDFRASCEDESGRRVVRLGGPPLQLILGVTGTTRQTYRLSWLDESPFALFQDS